MRKIANFTLAQSVPPAVVTSVNAYSKTFVGAIIEGARTVQEEWARAEGNIEWNEAGGALEVGQGWKADANGPGGGGVKRRALGPLLPDHIRESLRRWKRDGEAKCYWVDREKCGAWIAGHCVDEVAREEIVHLSDDHTLITHSELSRNSRLEGITIQCRQEIFEIMLLQSFFLSFHRWRPYPRTLACSSHLPVLPSDLLSLPSLSPLQP